MKLICFDDNLLNEAIFESFNMMILKIVINKIKSKIIY